MKTLKIPDSSVISHNNGVQVMIMIHFSLLLKRSQVQEIRKKKEEVEKMIEEAEKKIEEEMTMMTEKKWEEL